MRTSNPTVPAEPPAEMVYLLRAAVAELRHYPNDIIMSAQFQNAHEVADYLERLTDQLLAGDAAAGCELYAAFLATSDWDDACGSHELGNQLCEALRAYCPGAR